MDDDERKEILQIIKTAIADGLGEADSVLECAQLIRTEAQGPSNLPENAYGDAEPPPTLSDKWCDREISLMYAIIFLLRHVLRLEKGIEKAQEVLSSAEYGDDGDDA